MTLAALAYAVFLAQHICYAAGGSDSSGYLNEARLFAAGHASMRVRLVDVLNLDPSFTILFVPLGFRTAAHGMMLPTYPPGVPAIFAAAGMIGGWNIAPFLIGPLAALGCLLLIYAVARQLGLSQLFALAATALLAAFPAFILIAVQPVSDVIATFFALLTIWCALRARSVAAGASPAAFGAGFAFAAGVAVRPMNALLGIALVLALRGRKPLLIRAAAGMAPIAIALMGFNYALYGNPLLTGYGVYTVESAHRVWSAFAQFWMWCAFTMTPLIVPGGMLVVFDRHVGRWDRAMLVAWFLPFLLFYSLFGFDGWWFIRYVLPGLPAMIIGALLVFRDVVERIASGRLRNAVIAIVLLSMLAVPIKMTRKLHVTSVKESESVYPQSVAWAERQLPRNALVVCGQMSGSFLYYTDRFTVRWEFLDNDRFQLLRAYAGNAPWFAVLMYPEDENIHFQERMRGRWTQIGRCRNVTLWRLDS